MTRFRVAEDDGPSFRDRAGEALLALTRRPGCLSGHVGRAVAQIVLEERKRWLDDGIEVKYRAVSDTSGALVGEELLPHGIEDGGGHFGLVDDLER